MKDGWLDGWMVRWLDGWLPHCGIVEPLNCGIVELWNCGIDGCFKVRLSRWGNHRGEKAVKKYEKNPGDTAALLELRKFLNKEIL